ncbi:hypothetical protein BAUCODRAFT_375002 [Baudoinia panamericana UAMH 10762]|uniref:Uncharacterized protein n=1 Tax=Baudoinia panamericana (strain UAMH 10762) TaxID=717646 RepID=M2N3P4_BAUPA|nr:uncharacterized protein BAUCODRAFT_375002 [Baudoinia panamericana UAMH 10762]EMC98593.1 hypothetical protein BAUCODRAFT_375002 [Baudoinia panamericana UAMH 10762]
MVLPFAETGSRCWQLVLRTLLPLTTYILRSVRLVLRLVSLLSSAGLRHSAFR